MASVSTSEAVAGELDVRSVAPFTDVSAGDEHHCGLRSDGVVDCWGSNRWGRAQSPDGLFSAVSAGWSHTCGIRTDRTVECWGREGGSALDAPPGEFAAVSAGLWHAVRPAQ